jgi:outer membrane protein OmpA-like peptidoglycan-associated protein
MRAHSALLSLSAVVVVFSAPVAYGGTDWLQVVKDQAAAHAAGEVDQAIDATVDSVKCVVTDQTCIDQAQQSGKPVVVTNKKGKPLPADQQPKSAASGSAGATSPSGGAKSGSAGQAGGQPNLTAVKSDFVPGERTIFYDDFTDMAGDEPPPHWKVRGGMTELRTGGEVRQLTLTNGAIVLTPNLKALPRNLTLEVDLTLAGLSGNGGRVSWLFMTKDRYQVLELRVFAQISGESDDRYTSQIDVLTGDPTDNIETVGTAKPTIDWHKPIQLALWIQNGRVRLYTNGARLIDVNQIDVDMSKVASVDLVQDMNNSPEGVVGLRRVRFAESTPDFSKVISSGRYVTHGIVFDTDSDRIKSDSAAVIKMIANGLQSNPGLNLLIEGHTDSSGDAAHNMDLSKRRAAAVKTVLVSQFSIDAARLTTTGLGASKPIASNDTPQGRADNRRVEFVKQ